MHRFVLVITLLALAFAPLVQAMDACCLGEPAQHDEMTMADDGSPCHETAESSLAEAAPDWPVDHCQHGGACASVFVAATPFATLTEVLPAVSQSLGIAQASIPLPEPDPLLRPPIFA